MSTAAQLRVDLDVFGAGLEGGIYSLGIDISVGMRSVTVLQFFN